jgi:two-component system, cell cycle sensor histidine kinase and response regulator CckA
MSLLPSTYRNVKKDLRNIRDQSRLAIHPFFGSTGLRSIERIEMPKDMLSTWLEKIFFSIFITALVAASIPYFLNIKIAIASNQAINVAIYTIAYMTAIIVTFVKIIPFRIRAWVGLFLFYLMGVVSLTTVGPVAGGRTWLFMFAVLTTLILGLRAGVIALAFNLTTMVLWIWAWAHSYFAWCQTYQFKANQVLATGFSFFFMNAIVTISIGILVTVLRKGFEKEQNLSNDLRLSNEKLLKENDERKQAEVAVRENAQKYRLLADNVNDLIWMLDIHEQRLTYVSPSVKKMRGYSPEEVMQQSLEEMMTLESYQRTISVLTEELSGDDEKDPDRSVTIELEQYRKDKTTVWTEVIASFVRDNKKQPIAVLGVTRDITERKEAEAALRDKEEKLARSKKMESLGLMAGGIAHDLNNILSGIVSYPDLLLMDLSVDSPMREPIETIKESGQRAAAIVADLLTVARGVATSKEILNLNTVIEKYLGSAEQRKMETINPSIAFKTELDVELLNLKCSESHISKSLMNLVFNASEAIEGRGTVTISTKNRYLDEPLKGYENVRAGEYVLLTVSDNGIGISAKHLDRIFEPFYTKKILGHTGTGLGLAVVWNMAQDNDGYINVLSGQSGTEFELYLPATREEMDGKKGLVQPEDHFGQGQKILVVDDEESQRIIASRLLARMGYSAEAVSSGEEAVEYLKKHPVDLLLLDMIMPKGINGRETYEQILKIYPKQKAIIASGYAETADVKATQELGAGSYIKKPYTFERLGIVVKKELEAPL